MTTGTDDESSASSRMGGWALRFRSLESAAIAGMAYAVLAFVVLERFSRFPDLAQSEAALTAWFEDVANQASLIGALVAASTSGVAFLWFIAVVRRRLGDLEDKFFATAFLGSGLTYVGVWLTSAAALAAPAVVTTTLNGATVGPASASLAGGLGGGLLLVVAPRIQAVFISSLSTVT